MNDLHELYDAEYGEELEGEIVSIIIDIKDNSNFIFTPEYYRIANSFLQHMAREIIEGKRKKPKTLTDLITQAYGDAAIYKFNVRGDE